MRFLLDEDVYPRIHLRRGLPYAISTMLHYVILLIGFFAGLAALGVDMTKVTILAGAFSVGVGFGLQNIFNNFVSGLILLFERPINIGDMVQIDDASGLVEHIGIRASIIRTLNGSEIIVPNGKLPDQLDPFEPAAQYRTPDFRRAGRRSEPRYWLVGAHRRRSPPRQRQPSASSVRSEVRGRLARIGTPRLDRSHRAMDGNPQ